MSRTKIIEFTVEEQLVVAQQVLSMLNSEVHRDETTDPTGYNISKQRVRELSSKVEKKIKQGALQPSKVIGGF